MSADKTRAYFTQSLTADISNSFVMSQSLPSHLFQTEVSLEKNVSGWSSNFSLLCALFSYLALGSFPSLKSPALCFHHHLIQLQSQQMDRGLLSDGEDRQALGV